MAVVQQLYPTTTTTTRWLSFHNLTVIVAAFFIYTFRLPETGSEDLTFKRLVIGVISARDHLSHRNAIRQTWGSLVQDLPHVELVFVLGDRDCPLHPADRLSSRTCREWYIGEDIENSHVRTFFKSKNELAKVTLDSECSTGLGIKILHPVILEEVSVRATVLKNAADIFIILQDAKEMIESVKVSSESCSEENGYCSIKLPAPLYLPKGFEGELRVHKKGIDDISLCGEDLYSLQSKTKWVCKWINSSVINYKFVRTRKDVFTKWRKTFCPLVSAKFSIVDKNNLTVHKKEQELRTKEWKNHLKFLQKKIDKEGEKNNDLLILPLMDIYTHLPHKVMGFLDWVTHKYNSLFILKIDDDTFLNVPLLELLIKSEINTTPSWWSQFQYHRSVPVYGKWADLEYPALTYPTFPSGAGYLMTGSLARTVAAGRSYLASYGGEDVSMGIWVSSVAGNTREVDIPCWLPHPYCSQTVLVPQLSVAQLTQIWGKTHTK